MNYFKIRRSLISDGFILKENRIYSIVYRKDNIIILLYEANNKEIGLIDKKDNHLKIEIFLIGNNNNKTTLYIGYAPVSRKDYILLKKMVKRSIEANTHANLSLTWLYEGKGEMIKTQQ